MTPVRKNLEPQPHVSACKELRWGTRALLAHHLDKLVVPVAKLQVSPRTFSKQKPGKRGIPELNLVALHSTRRRQAWRMRMHRAQVRGGWHAVCPTRTEKMR
eukprot:427706-Rhodomonas_salina.3